MIVCFMIYWRMHSFFLFLFYRRENALLLLFSFMETLCYQQCYRYNIFTMILSWQVFINFHLNPPLMLFYYLLFIAWHLSIILKLLWKYCECSFIALLLKHSHQPPYLVEKPKFWQKPQQNTQYQPLHSGKFFKQMNSSSPKSRSYYSSFLE